VSVSNWDRWSTALCVGIAVAMIGLVWAMAGRGFDLTDEGYYLTLIARPSLFGTTSTQFGVVYHPLYSALGGNLALLRIANSLVTLTLAGVAAVSLISPNRNGRVLLAIGLSATSLSVLNGWMPTPSYNSLVLQGGLVTFIGLTLTISGSNFLGPLMTGVGGAATFLAKPTSAVALAVIVALSLAIARRLPWRVVVIASAAALAVLIIIALCLDGSVAGFVMRLMRAAKDGDMMMQGFGLWEVLRLDPIPDGWARATQVLGAIAAGTAVLIIGSTASAAWVRNATLSIVAAGFVALVALWIASGEPFWGRVLLFEPLLRIGGIGVMVGTLIGCVARNPRGLLTISRGQCALIFALALSPWMTALGTNNNYWIQSGLASFFWIAGAIAIADGLASTHAARSFVPIVAVGQALTALLLIIWAQHPYRLDGPVTASNKPVQIGKSLLEVSPGLARYLGQIRKIADANGAKPDQPIFDLTGKSPGALFAINAVPPSEPWLISGYKGSERFVRTAVARVSCAQRAQAWLLIEPGTQKSVDPAWVGADLRHYKIIGRFVSPNAVAGSNMAEQLLLRPVSIIDSSDAPCRSSG
jgi:hypothetical protein